MSTFVTLAGAPPCLWVGGLVFCTGVWASPLPALPSNRQISAVIYANWQARACGSGAICDNTITGTACNRKSTEAVKMPGYKPAKAGLY